MSAPLNEIPDPHLQEVDDGRLHPSSLAASAKYEGFSSSSPHGRLSELGHSIRKREQEPSSAAQIRNEPGSASELSVTNSIASQAADGPEGPKPPMVSPGSILGMLRSGMDTYAIGKKLHLHEAVVLRKLTAERREVLFG